MRGGGPHLVLVGALLAACGQEVSEPARPAPSVKSSAATQRAPVTAAAEPAPRVVPLRRGGRAVEIPARLRQTTIARLGPGGELSVECVTGDPSRVLRPEHEGTR